MLSRPRQTQQQEQPTASSSNASVVTSRVIPLLKGGGAIRGIGEKSTTNSLTSAVSMAMIIATSRSGFAPQLNLTYDSGSCSGSFGFGWSLSLLYFLSTLKRVLVKRPFLSGAKQSNTLSPAMTRRFIVSGGIAFVGKRHPRSSCR